MDYQQLKRFLTLLHTFHAVERVAHVPTLKRKTNGPEHVFQLAMVAWYIIATKKLSLNLELVLRYVLAHDLVEAYAGDTYLYDNDARATKAEREHRAFERISNEFAEFGDLLDSIKNYELRQDPESRFVYALDKLIDPLNASMDTAYPWWKEHNVTYAMLRASKDEKIASSPEVEHIWHQLTQELEMHKESFFPPET